MIVTHKTVMPKTVMMGKSPEAAADADQGWVALGVITKPKGVRGRVRITSFTERSADLVAYGPLHDGPAGRVVELTLHETLKGGVVVASIAGVSDRGAAEALRGIELHVPRSALPEAESDEYYHADLVGLEVVGADGGTIGEVAALHNFGAGDILEVSGPRGDSIMLPFDKDTVPNIDIPGGRLVIELPKQTDEQTGEKQDET